MKEFQKPEDVRYVDMAIYIDEHIYEENFDANLIFDYIYQLINMLAHKASLFKNKQYYEDFALKSATSIYMRLTNKKQFEFDEKGEPKLPKVKSVLNYIKKTLYAMKVDFEQEEYEKVQPELEAAYSYSEDYSLHNHLMESVDRLRVTDFSICMHDICKTIKRYLSHIPYRNDRAVWENIYLSCLLSLLNSITLSNKNKKRISRLGERATSEIIYSIYEQERIDQVILFRLDESMRGYINILTNSIRHLIAKDLASCLDIYVPSEVGIQNLLKSATDEDYGED